MGDSVVSHPMRWICRLCMILFVITQHVTQADEPEKAIVEPDAAPGCPIPDLRYSRPRKIDGAISTELPNVPSDVSQSASKDASTDTPDASDTNGFVAELTADREVGRHSRYINFDPYAWNDGKKPDRNAQSHTEHTIHRRRARSQQRQSKTPSTSIDTIDSLSSLNITEILNQTNNREIDAITNSFEIGIKLSPNGHNQEIDTGSIMAKNAPINDTSSRRVKRKSGKTTGALSRPKGASDSGSKSTSRKKDGASLDEEGQYIVHATDDGEGDSAEDEEDEDAVEHDLFSEVTEVRFPAELGNVGERKLCRIRCVQGKWVGPICATKEEGV